MNSSKEYSNLFSSFLSQSLEDRGYEDYVQKVSKGKCFMNRRYLILRNGVIAYYQDKPSEHSAKSLRPKGKVHILDTEIKRVDSSFAKKKNSPNMFQIAFTPAGTKKKTFWIFAVNTQDTLQQWMEAFEKSRSPVMAIHEEVEESDSLEHLQNQAPEPESKELHEQFQREENFKKNLELERQRSEKKKKEMDELKRVTEAEMDSKRKEEDRKRKHQEKLERSKLKKNKKLLERFWDYRLQGLIKSISRSEDFMRIFHLIGNFHEAATQAAKVLVTDLQLPGKKRKVSRLSENRFVYRNLLMFLAWEQDEPVRYKALGHEFRALQMIHEAVFFLNSEQEFPLKVPLAALVDFKGFRVLVLSVIPLDTNLTVVHGLKDPEFFLAEHGVYPYLSQLCQLLNIKEHSFQWESGIEPLIHLSVFTQVHESLGYAAIEDLENYVEEEKIYYLTQTADILPLDLDFNSPNMECDKRIRPEFFSEYFVSLTADGCINLSEGAMEDDDFELCEASFKVRTDKVIEIVELLDSLTIMPLDSKSFTQALHSTGINCRYIGLIAQRTALPHIRDLCIVEIIGRTCKRIFLQQLVDLIFEIDDNKDLENKEESMDKSLPITLIENNYRRENEIMGKSLNFIPDNIQNKEYRQHCFHKRMEKLLKWPGYKEIKEKLKESQASSQNFTMEGSLKDGIIDYLNLVFGAGEESEIFWEEILIKKASSHFSIPVEKLDKAQVNLHALLHSVSFHCGLQLDFSKDTMLGKTENPFNTQSLERLKEKSRCIRLEGLENKMVKELMDEVLFEDQKLEAGLLALKINKLMNYEPDFLGDTVLLAQIGEIFIERRDMESAISYAKDALMQIHPLHAEGVKSWCILIRAMMMNNMQDEALQCFDHALTALEYHWGPYHPMHCTLYSILAFLYMEKSNFDDALILYKNSLMCSLRVLGPNHPHTAEVYIELGTLYASQKTWGEAINSIEKGVLVYEAALGKTSTLTTNAVTKLLILYLETGEHDKCKNLIDSLIQTYEKGLEDSLLSSPEKSSNFISKLEEILEIGFNYCKEAKDAKFEKLLKNKLKRVQKEKENQI